MGKDKYRMKEDVGLHQDLEYAKRQEQKANIEKQNYKRILALVTKTSNIIVWEAVYENNIYCISDTIGPFEELTGYNSNELRGESIENLLTRRCYQSFINNINHKDTGIINLNMVFKDSKIKVPFHTVFMTSRKDDEFWKVFCISTMNDHQKSIYEVILENLNYSVIVLNNKDQVFYLNKAAEISFKGKPPVCFSELLEFINPDMRGVALNEFLNIKKGKKLGVKKYKLNKRKEEASINILKIDKKTVITIRLIK